MCASVCKCASQVIRSGPKAKGAGTRSRLTLPIPEFLSGNQATNHEYGAEQPADMRRGRWWPATREAAAGESGRRQQPARGRATNATLVIIQQPGEGSRQPAAMAPASKPSLHTAQQQPGQEGQRVPNDLASCTHTCQCKRLPCHAPRIRRRRPVPHRQPLPIPPLASPCRPRMPPQPPRTPPLQLLRRRSACHHGRMGGGNATSQPVGQTGVVRRPTTGTAGRGHFD